jgi:hypothetical protein
MLSAPMPNSFIALKLRPGVCDEAVLVGHHHLGHRSREVAADADKDIFKVYLTNKLRAYGIGVAASRSEAWAR